MPKDDHGDDVGAEGTENGTEVPAPPERLAANDTNAVRDAAQDKQIRELEGRFRSAEKWMIYLTGAVAFFALCQVVVGYLQRTTMERQLQEMQGASTQTAQLIVNAATQARESTRAVDVTVEQFRLDQRAWVAVSDARATRLEIDKPFRIDVTFKNTGKTPARDVAVAAHLERVKRGEKPKEPLPYPISRGILAPGAAGFITFNPFKKEYKGPNEAVVRSLRDQEVTLFIRGTIT